MWEGGGGGGGVGKNGPAYSFPTMNTNLCLGISVPNAEVIAG